MGEANISNYVSTNGTTIKWEHPVSITVDNINSNKSDTITDAVYDIFTRLNNLERNREENKVMKILDIYEERELEYIEDEFVLEREEILEKDKFKSLYNKFMKEIKDLYKKEYNEELKYEFVLGKDFIEKINKEKIEDLVEGKRLQIKNLKEKLEEVKARLEMTDDYDKQVEILKAYDILNEEGMINA